MFASCARAEGSPSRNHKTVLMLVTVQVLILISIYYCGCCCCCCCCCCCALYATHAGVPNRESRYISGPGLGPDPDPDPDVDFLSCCLMRPLNRNVSTVLILVLAPVLIPGSIFYCFALRIPRRIELESQYSDLDFFLLCVMRPRVGIPKPESQSSSDLGPGPDPIPISISDQCS